MNKIIENTPKGTVSARELSSWLLAHGISAVDTQELAHLMDIPTDHVRQRMVTLRKHSEFVCAGRGIWIPVSPEKRIWGAPEPIAYIDSVMKLMKTDYCVGWLSAAAFYGAHHQAAQVFQVAVSKSLRDRIIGRSQLRFYKRSYLADIPKNKLSLSAGRAQVAMLEATMLMLAADLELASGLDNAATVIVELCAHTDFSRDNLFKAATVFSKTAIRRVGWILETFSGDIKLDALAKRYGQSDTSVSYLSPYDSHAGTLNKRWNLIINRKVEPDL